jgi:hypothetical protein
MYVYIMFEWVLHLGQESVARVKSSYRAQTDVRPVSEYFDRYITCESMEN